MAQYATPEPPGRQAKQAKQQHETQCVLEQQLTEFTAHLVGVAACTVHPVPGLVPHHELQLGHRCTLARLREERIHEGATGLAAYRLAQIAQNEVAMGILDLVEHVLTGKLGADGMHHPNTLRCPDVHVLVALGLATVAHLADRQAGGLLRLRLSHLTLAGTFMKLGGNAVGILRD